MKSNKGFTLIELLIVVAIIGIIAAIAIPGLMRARMSGNEASAIGSLRAINSGQATYSASAAGGGYASGLMILATPCGNVVGAAPFLSPDLTTAATVLKSGYNVTMAGAGAGPLDCNNAQSSLTYTATATPANVGTSGQRSFFTDQSMSIWQDATGALMAGPNTTPIQ